jgi:hypothetical protein
MRDYAKHMFLKEFNKYKEELADSGSQYFKELHANMETSFDWKLAHQFILEWTDRCMRNGARLRMRYFATRPYTKL